MKLCSSEVGQKKEEEEESESDGWRGGEWGGWRVGIKSDKKNDLSLSSHLSLPRR